MAEQGAGLRGLVGAGSSRVSLSAAARVRDRGRPSAAELAAAEAEIDRRLAERPAVTRTAAGRSPTAGPLSLPGAGGAPTRARPKAVIPRPGEAKSATPKPVAASPGTPTPGDVGARRNRGQAAGEAPT